jgi:hypothetical protein
MESFLANEKADSCAMDDVLEVVDDLLQAVIKTIIIAINM